MLQKQTALIKVDEEDSVFDETDGHTDNLDNSLAPLFVKENMTVDTKLPRKLVNGDLLSSIAAKAPVTTCYSHIQRGKCIGEQLVYVVIIILSLTIAEGHSDNGYSVYIGMDINTGDLVAIYEWVLRCRQTKNDVFRRQKQVCPSICLYVLASVLL